MPAKELYCYRILKAYSLIIDFEGSVERENVPSPIEGETFKKWKNRVLGDKVSNIVVYAPYEPGPNTRIQTLQGQAHAGHLERVFKAFGKGKDTKKVAAVEEAVNDTKRQYSTVPKSTLHDILADTEHDLEPSVKEFFERFNSEVTENIGVEVLMRALINTYNNAVRIARKNSDSA